MKRLILNSRGANTTEGAEIIKSALKELGVTDLSNKKVLIVTLPEYEKEDVIVNNFADVIGFKKENTIVFERLEEIKLEKFDYIYIGEGNTFYVLQYMRLAGLLNYIYETMVNNTETVYIGSSAGATIAGTDVKIAVGPDHFPEIFKTYFDFEALGLIEGAILPHYTDEEFEEFKKERGDYFLSKYSKLYSVSNEEYLLLETRF